MESEPSAEIASQGDSDHPSQRQRKTWRSSPLLGVFFAVTFLGVLYLLLDQAQRWRVLRIPFSSAIRDEPMGYSETPEGRIDFVERVVTAKGCELPGYAIADIGDVRIAVERLMRLDALVAHSSFYSRVVIASNRPMPSEFGGGAFPSGSSSGVSAGGGLSFSHFRQKGVTECRLNNISFSVHESQIEISDTQIPIGKGRKVVFVRNDGSVSEIVDLD